MPADLAVIIVTHNTREPALRLLDSLREDPDRARWDVLVIDNDSADGGLAAIRERHPWVRTRSNVPQVGFAAAVNQGARLTDAPVVVTLNPDTIVPSGTMRRLRDELARDPRIAAVGPLIRYPDGRPQRQGQYRPRPLTALVVLLGLADAPILRREAERYYGRHEPGPPRDVQQLPGTCLMFRRTALEAIGGFDERFFVYCEDVDWSWRAIDAGWRLVYVPEVEIVHEKAVASRAASSRTIRVYYTSIRLFFGKHHAARMPAPLRALWYAGSYLKEANALAANALRREKGVRY